MSVEDLEIALSLLRVCGSLATRCKSGEYDEDGNRKALRYAGRSLRMTAVELVCAIDRNPLEDCTARLQETASAMGASYTPAYVEQKAQDAPVSWRELQLAEAEQLTLCDPELEALPPGQQMCRYAISLMAASSEAASAIESYSVDERHWRTFADLLLISVRLSSAAGDDLTDHAVPKNSEEYQTALMTDGGGF